MTTLFEEVAPAFGEVNPGSLFFCTRDIMYAGKYSSNEHLHLYKNDIVFILKSPYLVKKQQPGPTNFYSTIVGIDTIYKDRYAIIELYMNNVFDLIKKYNK